MSIKILTWAFDQKGLTPTEKVVLLALADWANDDGECYPGQVKIAEKTDLSESTVRRALKRLHDLGLVSTKERRREDGYKTSNLYRLHTSPVNLTAEISPVKSETSPVKSDGSHRSTVTGQEPSVEPSVEPSDNPPTPQGGSERDEEFEKIWAMWPRKVGKPAAQKAYASAAKRAKPEVIAAGITAALQFFARERTEIRFVPHLSTWLNQNRWEDELTPTNQPVAPVEGSGPRLAPDEKLIDGIIWRRGRPRLGGQYGMTVAQYQEWQAEQQRLIQEARDRRG